MERHNCFMLRCVIILCTSTIICWYFHIIRSDFVIIRCGFVIILCGYVITRGIFDIIWGGLFIICGPFAIIFGAFAIIFGASFIICSDPVFIRSAYTYMKVMVKRIQPKGPDHCRIRSNLNGINDVLHRGCKFIC